MKNPSSRTCFNCGSKLQFKGKGAYKRPYYENYGTVDRNYNAATNILRQGKLELEI